MKTLKPLTDKPPKPDPYRQRQADERHKLYVGRQWRKLRASVLQSEPLCRECRKNGKLTPAKVVDHIRGHGPDWRRHFYDPTNLQALCMDCHAVKTMAETRGRGGVNSYSPKADNPAPPNTRQKTPRKGD